MKLRVTETEHSFLQFFYFIIFGDTKIFHLFFKVLQTKTVLFFN